jgi:hypothetical protein
LNTASLIADHSRDSLDGLPVNNPTPAIEQNHEKLTENSPSTIKNGVPESLPTGELCIKPDLYVESLNLADQHESRQTANNGKHVSRW